MTIEQELPRDVFIDHIRSVALRDKNVYFLSADLGAKALDQFRVEANGQFLHVGISEQNMIDVAAGLALNGKHVYVYAMAPFVTLRCYEQIKVAIASMKLPVTIIGVGVGYSYNDAGPTHYATEDVSCMRALAGIEILTPSDTQSVLETAKRTYTNPAFRYVRLDRVFLPTVYLNGDVSFIEQGLVEIEKGQDICILTAGYMVQQALEVKKKLEENGISAGIVDVYRVKPLDTKVLQHIVNGYPRLATLEEHFLSGGLGSVIAEACMDASILKPMLRMGVEDQYILENGGRHYLHKLTQLDKETVVARVSEFCREG